MPAKCLDFSEPSPKPPTHQARQPTGTLLDRSLAVAYQFPDLPPIVICACLAVPARCKGSSRKIFKPLILTTGNGPLAPWQRDWLLHVSDIPEITSNDEELSTLVSKKTDTCGNSRLLKIDGLCVQTSFLFANRLCLKSFKQVLTC